RAAHTAAIRAEATVAVDQTPANGPQDGTTGPTGPQGQTQPPTGTTGPTGPEGTQTGGQGPGLQGHGTGPTPPAVTPPDRPGPQPRHNRVLGAESFRRRTPLGRWRRSARS